MRKLVYYVAMTIDGYIAAPDGDASFFPVTPDVIDFIVANYPETLPAHVRDQLGIADAPNRHFDAGVQGRTTYEPALEIGITSPFPQLDQYVVSRTLSSDDPAIEVVSGDLVEFVRELKTRAGREGKDIYLMGGATVAGELIDEIDSLVVKVYPLVAGAGVALFTADFAARSFTLTDSRALAGGMVVLTYDRA